MSLALCAKVAQTNTKASATHQGIRLKGKLAMATNMRNTICFNGTSFPENVDCVIDAPTFMNSYKVFKAPKVEQVDKTIVLSEGKTKAEIALSEDFFPFATDKNIRPEGTVSVEPKDFLAAVDRISGFLKLATNKISPEAYIINGFIYVTDGMFLVRTPLETQFPPQTDRPLTISREFVEIIESVKKVPVEILISQDSFSIVFEDLWVETTRYAGDMPADFESYFAHNASKPTEAMPEDVLETLKGVCEIGDKDDTLSFTKMGISLMKQGKVTFNIAHAMPSMFLMNCHALKTCLNSGSEFNFEDPKRVIFKGKDVEGSWTKYSALQTSP